jgi:hypothetical protein
LGPPEIMNPRNPTEKNTKKIFPQIFFIFLFILLYVITNGLVSLFSMFAKRNETNTFGWKA